MNKRKHETFTYRGKEYPLLDDIKVKQEGTVTITTYIFTDKSEMIDFFDTSLEDNINSCVIYYNKEATKYHEYKFDTEGKLILEEFYDNNELIWSTQKICNSFQKSFYNGSDPQIT